MDEKFQIVIEKDNEVRVLTRFFNSIEEAKDYFLNNFVYVGEGVKLTLYKVEIEKSTPVMVFKEKNEIFADGKRIVCFN